MAELEYLMAARKVYGHRSRPASPKASSHRTSLPTPHIRNIFARSLENAISKRATPESTIRTAVSQSALSAYWVKRYWLHTPDRPQLIPPRAASRKPFAVFPFAIENTPIL